MKFTEFSLLRGPNLSYRTSKFGLKSVVQQFTMILKLSSPLSTYCCILQQQQMEDTRKAGGTMHTTAPDTPGSSFPLHCRVMEGLPATLRDVCQR